MENLPVPEIDVMTGMKYTIVFTASGDKDVLMRTYAIKIDRENVDKEDLSSSGSNASAIGLTEIGPSGNLTIRREQWATDDVLKKALK